MSLGSRVQGVDFWAQRFAIRDSSAYPPTAPSRGVEELMRVIWGFPKLMGAF